MTSKEVSAIAIKFFGIWFLLNLVIYLPSAVFALTSYNISYFSGSNLSFFMTAIGIYIVIGILCVAMLFRLANSVLETAPSSDDEGINLSEKFILQVLGIYLVISTIPSIATVSFSSNMEYSHLNWLYLGAVLFKLVVGILLLTTSKTWVQWLRKLRGH